jgi:hypothetical protein
MCHVAPPVDILPVHVTRYAPLYDSPCCAYVNHMYSHTTDIPACCTLVYPSRSRKNTTYIGIGSNDEMCFSYITYWPRMPKISACFSIHWAPGYAFCGHEDQFTPPDNQKDVEAYVKALTQRGLLVPSADRPAPFKAYSQQCTRAKA